MNTHKYKPIYGSNTHKYLDFTNGSSEEMFTKAKAKIIDQLNILTKQDVSTHIDVELKRDGYNNILIKLIPLDDIGRKLTEPQNLKNYNM